MTLQANRRSFIAAIPAAAVAVAIPATAIAAPADRRAWEFAMADYLRAKEADDAYRPTYERIQAAWVAQQPSMDMIHWKEFWPSGSTTNGRCYVARTMDLDAAWRLFLKGEGMTWNAANPEKRKAEYRAALDSVQAFRDAEAAISRESGMDEADARHEALDEALGFATDRLIETPAPDLAALRWKIDFLTSNGTAWDEWSAEFAAQTMQDFARLLPTAA